MTTPYIQTKSTTVPNERGYYGDYGGRFVPETIVPALYNSTPIPDVRRRFQDKDPVGKVAGQVMQRSLAFSVDEYDFDDIMISGVHDSELS
ncbi:MAG: hypothetical protein ACPG7F_21100, partial [Aggregatilineales bacterium]